jgi:hypothetical protein
MDTFVVHSSNVTDPCDRKFAGQQQIGGRLFYAVSAVKLVDEAASIEFMNKFCVN